MINKEKLSVLKQLVNYHESYKEIINDDILLKKSFTDFVASIAWKNLVEYCKVEFIDHFDFEEKVIFPALKVQIEDVDHTQLHKRLIKGNYSGIDS